MLKIKLGKKARKDFAYSVEDVGSKKVKFHGNHKGKALLKAKHRPWTPKEQDTSGELKPYRFK